MIIIYKQIQGLIPNGIRLLMKTKQRESPWGGGGATLESAGGGASPKKGCLRSEGIEGPGEIQREQQMQRSDIVEQQEGS